MNNTALVSVLINNYNYRKYLKTAIDSALGQKYPNLEVVVVDDGSKDGSIELINEYDRESIIKVVKENGGQASAFNAGFKACHGEVICFLDSDDFFYEDKVSKIIEKFSESPQIGWIFHRLEYVDASGELMAIDSPPHSIETSQAVDYRSVLLAGQRFAVTLPATSGLCFKRDVLRRILPMPEEIPITSDNYIKYAAIALSSGLFSIDKLAAQRIHTTNSYTFRPNNHSLRAEINIKTGYYLRQNFPYIHLFADKVFTRGCGEMLAERGYKSLKKIPEYTKYLQHYSDQRMLTKNILKAFLHCLRFKLLQLRRCHSSETTPSPRTPQAKT